MTNATITSAELKKALEAINHPHYSHATSRVMGIISIYHQDPAKPDISGRRCAANIPQEFSFLLTVAGKSYSYNPEFGLVTPN
jgi:hypothetical protein